MQGEQAWEECPRGLVLRNPSCFAGSGDNYDLVGMTFGTGSHFSCVLAPPSPPSPSRPPPGHIFVYDGLAPPFVTTRPKDKFFHQSNRSPNLAIYVKR